MIHSVDLIAQHRALRAEILEAVGRVLDHGQFILGPEVGEFERKMAEFLGARHVIGVNSGTDALLFALRGLGIGPGDEVLTVSHSYVATASAIALCGATPVFVDVDDSMLMDPQLLPELLTSKTRAVLPVHLNGYPADLGAISSFCDAHGLQLVEDCAQAIGATFGGKRVGTFGVGCFSLHPIKALGACGDGGFIVTEDDDLAAHLRELRTIGHRDRDHVVHVSSNSRLDTIQAAILLVKLAHLDDALAVRRAHAAAYRAALPTDLWQMPLLPNREGIYAQFVIRHPRRDEFQQLLSRRGVDTKVHYPIPIHRQAAFAHLPHPSLPNTERIVDEIVSLPISAELSPADRDTAITEIIAALDELR